MRCARFTLGLLARQFRSQHWLGEAIRQPDRSPSPEGSGLAIRSQQVERQGDVLCCDHRVSFHVIG